MTEAKVTIKMDGEVFKIFQHGEDDFEFFDVWGDWSERGTLEDMMNLVNDYVKQKLLG